MLDRTELIAAGFSETAARAILRECRMNRDFQADLTLPKPRRKLSIWKPSPAQPMPRVEPDRRTIGAIHRSPNHDLEISNARYDAERAAIADRWHEIEHYEDTPATKTLSALGELQDSHLRYIRSLKRAETLLDALLAPYIAAACKADYLPPLPHPAPHWAEWIVPGDPDKPSRPAKRKGKRSKGEHAPLIGPHPSDIRGDDLDPARVMVASDYCERLAQAARYRFGLSLHEWREIAERNDYYPRRYAEPPTDEAAAAVAEHWADVAGFWQGGLDYCPDSLPLRYPSQPPAEPAELPASPILGELQPWQVRVASLIAAGASDSDISRQTSLRRHAIPAIRKHLEAMIREKLREMPPIPADEDEQPPAYRRAVQREAVALLRR